MPISLTKQGQLSATFDGSAGVLMPGLDAYRSVSVPGVLYIPSDTKDGQAAEAMIGGVSRRGERRRRFDLRGHTGGGQ
jgi:hypothetical protein